MLPDVEGTPLRLSSTLGQVIPFDRSPHTHAAYLAALALFEPGTLASLRPRSLAKLLHAVHPHMVSLLTGLLSSGLRHSHLQVPLQHFSLTPNQSC